MADAPSESPSPSSSPSCCSSKMGPAEVVSQKSRFSRYTPLFALLFCSLLAAGAKQVHYGAWEGMGAMHDFMGLFLLIFSLLKLFDLSGFADGFQKYDLLAMRSRGYAKLYPFLELALALGYLSGWQLQIVYTATILLMTFGAVGVLRTLSKGKDIKCACMGSSLDVPLSTVALFEDIGMAAMAAIALALSFF